jgi:hypothetical protein
VRPPPSPALIRFPAVSGKTPGFPGHSRGRERHFRSLLRVRSDRRGKNAARSLACANPFPADFIPTDRDGFARRLRPVRIHGRRPPEWIVGANPAARISIGVIGASSLLGLVTIHQEIDFLKHRGNLVPDVNELYRDRGLLSSGQGQEYRQYLVRMTGEGNQMMTARAATPTAWRLKSRLWMT